MNQFKELTPTKLMAFNEVCKNIGIELTASIMAFDLAFDYDATALEAFKQLKELNDFILEETFKEYKRKTIENKFK